MEIKPFVTGTVVGGLTILLSGYSLFALPQVGSFYDFAMTAGQATGVPRDAPLPWAVVLGALSYAALVTLAINSQASHPSATTGLRIGAVVGLLLWLTADFMLFGISNVGSLSSTIAGPFLESIPGAAAGGVIAAVLGRTGIAHLPRAAGRTPA